MAFLLSSEDISRTPPGSINPLVPKFSPDGSLFTYLYPNQSGMRQVFAVKLDEAATATTDAAVVAAAAYKPSQLLDIQASAAGLSLQEQLRRERMRLFASGVTSYEYVGERKMVFFHTNILYSNFNSC